MKYYYVHIVERSDKSLYTGLTNDLEKRINEHNFGLNDNSYTSKRRPVKLIFHQNFIQFHQAETFEKKLKKWSKKNKLALAKGDVNLLKLLSSIYIYCFLTVRWNRHIIISVGISLIVMAYFRM